MSNLKKAKNLRVKDMVAIFCLAPQHHLHHFNLMMNYMIQWWTVNDRRHLFLHHNSVKAQQRVKISRSSCDDDWFRFLTHWQNSWWLTSTHSEFIFHWALLFVTQRATGPLNSQSDIKLHYVLQWCWNPPEISIIVKRNKIIQKKSSSWSRSAWTCPLPSNSWFSEWLVCYEKRDACSTADIFNGWSSGLLVVYLWSPIDCNVQAH